jgi:hypothetical protein
VENFVEKIRSLGDIGDKYLKVGDFLVRKLTTIDPGAFVFSRLWILSYRFIKRIFPKPRRSPIAVFMTFLSVNITL